MNSHFLYLLASLLVLVSCKGPELPASAAPKPELIVRQIDAVAVAAGLPFYGAPKQTVGGNGRLKQVWQISGSDMNKLEVIGNDQADADLVGWNCSDYNKAGDRIHPLDPASRCHKLFVQVLGKFVTEAPALASALIKEGVEINPRSASKEVGDFSFETDGEYYFVRRISRMK